MLGRDRVESIGYDDRRCVGPFAGLGLRRGASQRIDGFDEAGIADGNVDKAVCGVEEGHVRNTRYRPYIGNLSGDAINRVPILRHGDFRS